MGLFGWQPKAATAMKPAPHFCGDRFGRHTRNDIVQAKAVATA